MLILYAQRAKKSIHKMTKDNVFHEQIDYFISTLEELNAPVTEFDEQLWISMVDHVLVHSKEDIRVVYRDGIER